jgi:hypothetical protein
MYTHTQGKDFKNVQNYHLLHMILQRQHFVETHTVLQHVKSCYIVVGVPQVTPTVLIGRITHLTVVMVVNRRHTTMTTIGGRRTKMTKILMRVGLRYHRCLIVSKLEATCSGTFMAFSNDTHMSDQITGGLLR